MNLTNNEIHYLQELVEQDIRGKPSIDNHEKKRNLLCKLDINTIQKKCNHEFVDDGNGVLVCAYCERMVLK